GDKTMTKQKSKNIDEYVSQFPLETQEVLNALLTYLFEVVPEAEKGLKWGVPAFTYRRVLFTVAAFKNHINYYPTPTTIKSLQEELDNFSTIKHAIQFPLNQHILFMLILIIAEIRSIVTVYDYAILM